MRSTSTVIGLLLVVAGLVALAGSIGGLGMGATFRWLLPVLIIGLGAWAVLAAVTRGLDRDRWASPAGAQWGPSSAAAGPDASFPGSGPGVPPWGSVPFTRYERVFGDLEMAGPMNLGATRFSTVFGEVRLDLTSAVLPEGETDLSVSTVFGEVRVLLPAGVAAHVRAGTLVGDIEVLGQRGGSFFADLDGATDDLATATRRVKLDVRTVFGEVAVRRARGETPTGSAGLTGG
jgi:hypothetical protein